VTWRSDLAYSGWLLSQNSMNHIRRLLVRNGKKVFSITESHLQAWCTCPAPGTAVQYSGKVVRQTRSSVNWPKDASMRRDSRITVTDVPLIMSHSQRTGIVFVTMVAVYSLTSRDFNYRMSCICFVTLSVSLSDVQQSVTGRSRLLDPLSGHSTGGDNDIAVTLYLPSTT